jgi:hypothetical protein
MSIFIESLSGAKWKIPVKILKKITSYFDEPNFHEEDKCCKLPIDTFQVHFLMLYAKIYSKGIEKINLQPEVNYDKVDGFLTLEEVKLWDAIDRSCAENVYVKAKVWCELLNIADKYMFKNLLIKLQATIGLLISNNNNIEIFSPDIKYPDEKDVDFSILQKKINDAEFDFSKPINNMLIEDIEDNQYDSDDDDILSKSKIDKDESDGDGDGENDDDGDGEDGEDGDNGDDDENY